jgi:hypothetical protein
VRLDRVAEIVERVMDTVDRNPRILENLTDRLGETLAEVGSGAGRAVGQLGEGAGSAVASLGDSVEGLTRRATQGDAQSNGR